MCIIFHLAASYALQWYHTSDIFISDVEINFVSVHIKSSYYFNYCNIYVYNQFQWEVKKKRKNLNIKFVNTSIKYSVIKNPKVQN